MEATKNGFNKLLDKIKDWWGFFSITGKIAVTILIIIIIMGIFAPLLSSFPHDASSGPPLHPPGGEHFLGTDELGVDLWAMITYGARVSIMVGLGTALMAGLGGGIVGIVAGYKGGWFDKIIMRIIDVMIALPDLPAMIVIAGFFGSSLTNIIIVLSLFSWSRPARIARAQALSLREQPYLKMASFYGGSTPYLLYKHFVPELFPILSVSMIRLASRAIVTEASLAFIGLGDPTSRSWGLILNHAINFSGIYFTPYWTWWLLYPWIALTLLVVSLALLGRDLERIADPRMQ